jgi:amino acid transporter
MGSTPVSCGRSSHASVGLTGVAARLIYAASRDHFLPEVFSRLHQRRRTPDNAMALQAGLTIFYVVFGGGFRSQLLNTYCGIAQTDSRPALLNFFSVTSWAFYLLTVLGLLVLRVKEPHLDRPYRTFIITPIIFCAVSLAPVHRTMTDRCPGGRVPPPDANIRGTRRSPCCFPCVSRGASAQFS